jgi:hypothetical protein
MKASSLGFCGRFRKSVYGTKRVEGLDSFYECDQHSQIETAGESMDQKRITKGKAVKMRDHIG